MHKNSLTLDEVNRRLKDKSVVLIEPYSTCKTRTLGKCLVCNHEWKLFPDNVFRGQQGCPPCANKRRANYHRLSQEEVSRRLGIIGIEAMESYVDDGTPILVRRIECGHQWMPTLDNVFQGQGCPTCAISKSTEARKLPIEEVVKRFSMLELQMIGSYQSNQHKVLSRCLKCSHEWSTKPNHVFAGHGCPQCAPYGFQSNKPAIFYYLRVSIPDGTHAYKVGITNRTVRERFKGDLRKIDVVSVRYFENGQDAYDEEQRIIRKYHDFRYKGKPVFKSAGTAEMFYMDVLGTDRDQTQRYLISTYRKNPSFATPQNRFMLWDARYGLAQRCA